MGFEPTTLRDLVRCSTTETGTWIFSESTCLLEFTYIMLLSFLLVYSSLRRLARCILICPNAGLSNTPVTGAFHWLFWILCRLPRMLVGKFWAWYWGNKMVIAAYFLDGTCYSNTYWQPCLMWWRDAVSEFICDALMWQRDAVSEFIWASTWLCSCAMRFQSIPTIWPMLTIESPVAQQ